MVLLRFLVLLFGVTLWESSLATAALATNDVHLPGETDFPRSHHHQYQGVKASYPTPSSVVTYHFEHEQTELAARQYVASLNDTELRRVPAWCKPCNASVLHYCRTTDFLNDHCCCEYSHTREQLPWMPHTCLRQLDERCTANAGSCSKYRAIKECCCDRLTKLEYKAKFSTAAGSRAFHSWQLLLATGALAAAAIRYFHPDSS
uniref:CCC domain-containing protein n=1 Tax=Anopheles atroparvus TaxID=41427 RepID=A0AAG5CNI0_ANOAO